MYAFTALLKLSPAWLSGGQLFARTGYLTMVYDWPYPRLAIACTTSHACATMLAWLAVLAEFALAGLVAVGRTPLLALLLACAVHGFALITVNVWFFSLSLIAHVALLGARVPAKLGALRASG